MGDRGLDADNVEYRAWTNSESQDIALDQIVEFIQEQG